MWRYFFVAIPIILVLSVFRGVVDVVDYVNTAAKYPSFDHHAQTYHSVIKIHHSMRFDNNINPFYTWTDLTPDINPSGLKIYGYVPAASPDVMKINGHTPPEPDMDKFTLRVMIICNQHGREVVTGELCYNFIRLLQLHVRDDNFTVQLGKHTISGAGYWIVPVMNPWARQLVENNISEGCKRHNANGVDLNRNFPSQHRSKTRRASDEEEPGPYSMSEYETVAIDKFMKTVMPHIIFNVHSGGHDILLPYDGSEHKIPPHYSRMINLASYARKRLCPSCHVGQSSLAYGVADGTLIDYAVNYMATPLAYTLEIYTNASVSDPQTGVECRNFFNPKPGEDLSRVLKKWTAIILRMVDKLILSIKV